MKHRTLAVFIMLIAALAALPPAFQQIAELKEAAGNRVSAGIWNALLSIHGQRLEAAPSLAVAPSAGTGCTSSPRIEQASNAKSETKAGRSLKPRGAADVAQRGPALVAAPEIDVKVSELAMLADLPRVMPGFDVKASHVFRSVAPAPPSAASKPAPVARVVNVSETVELARFGKLFEGKLRQGVCKIEKDSAKTVSQCEVLRATRALGKRQNEYYYRHAPLPVPAEMPEPAVHVESEGSDTNY